MVRLQVYLWGCWGGLGNQPVCWRFCPYITFPSNSSIGTLISGSTCWIVTFKWSSISARNYKNRNQRLSQSMDLKHKSNAVPVKSYRNQNKQILYPWFIVPNSAATFICEPGVKTVTAPRRAPFTMVPDLFWYTGHKWNGQTHPFCSPNTTNSMHIIWLLIR